MGREERGGGVSGAVQVAATPLRLLEAAEGGAVLAELGVVALRAQGADAASFLHGQVANDVTGLPVGGANLTLALNLEAQASWDEHLQRTRWGPASAQPRAEVVGS